MAITLTAEDQRALLVMPDGWFVPENVDCLFPRMRCERLLALGAVEKKLENDVVLFRKTI